MPEVDAVVGADGHRRASGGGGAVFGAVDNLHRDEVTRAAVLLSGAVPTRTCSRGGHDTHRHPLPASTHAATKRSVSVPS